MTTFPSGAVVRSVVRRGWTTPNSCQAPPQVQFLVLCYGSNRFKRGELRTPNSWEIALWSLFPLELSGLVSGSQRFGRIELPWTHVELHHRSGSLSCAMIRTGLKEVNHPELMKNIPYDQCSPWSSVVWLMVWRGSVGLNHPELMRNYPKIVISSGTHWFEEVWKRWTTPNSWETSAQRACTPCAGVVRCSTVLTVVHVTVEVSRLYSWACAEAGWNANRMTDIQRWGVAGDGEFNEWKKGRTDGGLGEWKWWKGLEPN